MFYPAHVLGDTLVLEETLSVSFEITPLRENMLYRIFIGDVSVSELLPNVNDANGSRNPVGIYWREWPYLESARGLTCISVESKQDRLDANLEWQPLFSAEVFVIPSKIGESSYLGMTNALRQLSRDLLADLYGKSTRTQNLRLRKEGSKKISRPYELKVIVKVIEMVEYLLSIISVSPASRITHEPVLKEYWGDSPLMSSALLSLAQRGVSPLKMRKPFGIRVKRKIESFDIPEHRVLQAFLKMLASRIDYCSQTIRSHIDAILADRQYRELNIADTPSLFDTIDRPKILRLRGSLAQANDASERVKTLRNLNFLKKVPPHIEAVSGGIFQRNKAYQSLLQTIKRFLLSHAVFFAGDENVEITKLTSRLFEQWCFLKMVEAFRKTGVSIENWDSILAHNVKDRFLIDFDRGLMFDAGITPDLRLRIRYEPWILGYEPALKKGESLCRGVTGENPWSPDILIECLQIQGGDFVPVYGIAIDSKYTRRLDTHHWNDTEKYFQIRSTVTRRQIVRQLCLIAPSESPSITSRDPSLFFGEDGPSCPKDENVSLSILVLPDVESDTEVPEASCKSDEVFDSFAQGTIRFLKREFA